MASFPRGLPAPRACPLRGGATLRWGVLAPGEIARDFTTAMHTYTDQRVHAVASRSIERAQRFATIHGIAKAYGAYEELVANPAVEVVYIAAPHSEHARLTLLAISAGKHVLVEKPIALNADEARAIAAAARSAGVFAMEAMWSRYLPQTDVASQLIDDGVLGDIRLVTADFGERLPIDPAGRGYSPKLGGGALLDLGVYPVWFASFVLGAPKSVSATGSLTATGVDEQTALVLDYASGAQALLSTNLLVQTPGVAVASGSDARIEFDPLFLMPGGFQVVSAHSDERFVWRDASGLHGRDGLAWEAAAVAQHIADGLTESPLHPLDRSISMMEIIDEGRRQIGYHP